MKLKFIQKLEIVRDWLYSSTDSAVNPYCSHKAWLWQQQPPLQRHRNLFAWTTESSTVVSGFSLLGRQCFIIFQTEFVFPLANIIIFFVCPSKTLHEHCFYFLLGLIWKQCLCEILEEKTKSIMAFFILANCSSIVQSEHIPFQLFLYTA